MSESTFTYEDLLDAPIEAVWAAMKRTSELDILGGQKVVARVSDADWTTQIDDDSKHTSHCTATYDEATHTVTVRIDSSVKRVDDTCVLRATPEGAGTRLHLEDTVRGGLVVAGMLKLIGGRSFEGVHKAVARNIAALAAGGEAHALTQDEIGDIAKGRLDELKK